jgi:transposase
MGVSKFSSEVRERSVQLVLEQEAQHKNQWQAITSVAQKIGCTAETVRSWVRQYERDGGRREGPTSSEKERIKALEREVKELRRTNEILRLASAFFAKAEFDRQQK